MGWLRIRGLVALGLLAATLLLGCVLLFPQWLYPSPSAAELDREKLTGKERLDTVTERLKLQNEARATLLQGLGGAVVLLGAYFTYRQLITSREQLLHAVEASREQLRVTQEGQITERFTRAVDQLGSASEDVRLGGIYALQQISRDSPEESSAIYEILAAYVRIHAPWQERHDTGPVDVKAIPRLREWVPAVQAAMLVLGRRSKAAATGRPLDLMGTNLRRLRLSNTYIPDGANLTNVLFWRSSLINASLGHANLREAKLGWTDLRHSWLSGADLRDADLRGADLRHASLNGADLRGADLRGCDLRDIEHLDHANLAGAKVNGKTEWPDRFEWHTAGVVIDPES
jgi:Pentapeptide repeats (8 copies)